MNFALYVREKRADFSKKLMRTLKDHGHDAFRVTPERGRTRWGNVNEADLVINWGCGTTPDWNTRVPWLNQPTIVNTLAHKLRMFRFFARHNIPCVPWTANHDQVQEWLADGKRVAVRNVLQGHSGQGMAIIEQGIRIPDAPLFTKMIRGRRKREYRIIYMNGDPLLWMRKRRRNGVDMTPEQELIRTHRNGWIYASNDVWRQDENQAGIMGNTHTIIEQLNNNLNGFGALDIIGDIGSGEVWALEVNTAPGLASASTMGAVVGGLLNE